MHIPEKAIPKWIVAHPRFCDWFMRYHRYLCNVAMSFWGLCFAVMTLAIANDWSSVTDVCSTMIMISSVPILISVLSIELVASEVEGMQAHSRNESI